MRGRRGARATLLAAVLLAFLPPATLAEIRHEVHGDEIVVTNLPLKRPAGPPSAGGHARPTRAVPAGAGGAAPAAPPEIADLVSGSAERFGFDPLLIRAIVAAESAFNERAVSKKGARGLMQLMPDTAHRYGLRDLHDPATNVEAGVAYLRELVQRFGGSVELAIAAYNAGPEAVARYGGVPPYEETRQYLARIRGFYGPDLDRGDRTTTPGGIRVTSVEPGGVPHFTNLPQHRPVRVTRGASR